MLTRCVALFPLFVVLFHSCGEVTRIHPFGEEIEPERVFPLAVCDDKPSYRYMLISSENELREYIPYGIIESNNMIDCIDFSKSVLASIVIVGIEPLDSVKYSVFLKDDVVRITQRRYFGSSETNSANIKWWMSNVLLDRSVAEYPIEVYFTSP